MSQKGLLKRAFAILCRQPAQNITTTSFPNPARKMNNQQSPTFYDPKSQPFYVFRDGLWQPWTADASHNSTSRTFTSIRLLSWNIDFQAPLPNDRMAAALSHLSQIISSLPPTNPSLILLQEITASDLRIIQSAPWIRNSFYLTDLTSANWQASYGTLTLIDRRLTPNSIFRVRYASDMGRDALFVDLEDKETSTTVRVCNTHLESLRVDPPLRPAQVRLASRYLKDPTVDGGVIAGDFNAIQDFDLTLHEENGLRDAYLEGGGAETAEEGWTWGMQSMYGAGEKFGCSRMDKILSCGKLDVRGLQRFGMGVQIKGMEEGPDLYVTDHLGLMADVVLDEEFV